MRFVEGREPFLRRLRVRGLLSFGPDTPEFEFSPLDVLIGANAAGKSNFLEAIRLLAAAPTDLAGAVRRRGGVGDWLWKGEGAAASATLSAEVGPYPETGRRLRYHLEITGDDHGRPVVSDERVEEAPSADAPAEGSEARLIYGTLCGRRLLRVAEGWKRSWSYRVDREAEIKIGGGRKLIPSQHRLRPDESVLARHRDTEVQHRDAEVCPELSWLARQLGRIAVFGARPVGPEAPVRRPQPAGLRGDRLLPDASNLASVWREIERREPGRPNELLRRFLPRWERMSTRESDGKIECLFHEFGLEAPVPAAGVADGTIAFVTVLTALLAPSPPSVLCLEKPETDLHPDHLFQLECLLADACEHTQVLLTTHSDDLVSGFTDRPESVAVCERRENGTVLRRLDPKVVEEWAEDGPLGDLWRFGALGGTP